MVRNEGSLGHRGDKRFRFVRAAVLVAVIVVLSGVSIIAVVASGTRGAVNPIDVISLLGRDPGPEDALDLEEVPESPVPLDLASSRLVHSADGTTFWALTDDDRNVCMIAKVEDGDRWAAALSCTEPRVLKRQGLELSVSIGGRGTDATLLADGAANENLRSQVQASGGFVPADNLVFFPLGKRPVELLVDTGLGSVIDLGNGTP